jgi:hypothetical protein
VDQDQHIALSVAAGLARTQLSPDPLKLHDASHLTEMLDIVARALAKVAPLYVREMPGADPRPLTAEEQESASIRKGASVLVLKAGRTFSSVTMKRGDLRQAVAVLKAVGIPELAVNGQRELPPALAALEEIEILLRPPLVQAQLERANRLVLALARGSPQGHISNLAMQLMSCLHDAPESEALPDACWLILARLRAALAGIVPTDHSP